MNGHYSRWWALATTACIGNVVVLAIPTLLLNGPSRFASDTRLITLLLGLGAWTFCETFASRNSRHPFLNEEDHDLVNARCGLGAAGNVVNLRNSICDAPCDSNDGNRYCASCFDDERSCPTPLVDPNARPLFFQRHGPRAWSAARCSRTVSIFAPPVRGRLVLRRSRAALLYKSIAGVSVASFVLLPLVILRTRSEDAMLVRHHPIDFRRYRSRVGGLVLKLW